MSILFQDKPGKTGPKGRDAGNQIIPYAGTISISSQDEIITPLGFTRFTKEYTDAEDIVCFRTPIDLTITKFFAVISVQTITNNPKVKFQVWNSALDVTNILFETETLEITSTPAMISLTPIKGSYTVSAGDDIAVCFIKESDNAITSINCNIYASIEIKI